MTVSRSRHDENKKINRQKMCNKILVTLPKFLVTIFRRSRDINIFITGGSYNPPITRGPLTEGLPNKEIFHFAEHHKQKKELTTKPFTSSKAMKV